MWINTYNTMSWLSCTESYHYGMNFCEALLFFCYVQKNQTTCQLMPFQHDMSCHLAWSGRQNLLKCQADILNILKACRHVLGWHVIRGGSSNMTWCRHFQLSGLHKAMIEGWFSGPHKQPQWYCDMPKVIAMILQIAQAIAMILWGMQMLAMIPQVMHAIAMILWVTKAITIITRIAKQLQCFH